MRIGYKTYLLLKYCLSSLYKTCHTNTYFTIVNNDSCQEIIDYLNELHEAGQAHEVIHTTAIGKLNAILKGFTGQSFKVVTISDADLLFMNDWQNATYVIFDTFPKTGVVSVTPNSKMVRYLTSNVLFEKAMSKQLQFSKVLNPLSMKAFAHSIGTTNLFNNHHLNKYLSLSKGEIKAVIGAGHFVATYRGDIFDHFKQKNSTYNLDFLMKRYQQD